MGNGNPASQRVLLWRPISLSPMNFGVEAYLDGNICVFFQRPNTLQRTPRFGRGVLSGVIRRFMDTTFKYSV